MSTVLDGPQAKEGAPALLWRLGGVAASLLADITWTVAWLLLATATYGRPDEWLVVAWLLGVGLLAYAVSAMTSWFDFPAGFRHVLAGLILAGCVLATIHLLVPGRSIAEILGEAARRSQPSAAPSPLTAALMVLAGCAFIWWRGAGLAHSRMLNPVRENLRLRLGILLFAVRLAIRTTDLRGTFDLLLLFFLAAMLATSMARADDLIMRPTGRRAVFGTRWLGGLLAIFMTTVVLGLLLGWVLQSPAAYAVIRLIGLAAGLVLGAVFQLLLPVVALLDPLLNRLILWLQSLFLGLGSVLSNVNAPSLTPGEQTPSSGSSPAWLEALQRIWPSIEVALLVAGAILLLVLVTRARRASGRQAGRVEGEDPLTPDGRLLHRLMDRLAQSPGSLTGWVRSLASGRLLTRIAVRRIYAQLLMMAARDGRPRRKDLTPREYLPTLVDLYPGSAAEIQTITDGYLMVRYGARQDDPDIRARVTRAWQRMRAGAG